MSSHKTADRAAEDPRLRWLSEITIQIEADRVRLNEEIRSYPSPIPACDAQFNYLLEEKKHTSRKQDLLKEIAERYRAHGAKDQTLRDLIIHLGQIDAQMAQRVQAELDATVAPDEMPLAAR